MSDRRKYAFNGLEYFENVREHMERHNFIEIPVGSIGGIDGWVLKMRRNLFDDNRLFVFICTLDRKPKIKYRCYTSILKINGSLSSECNHYLEKSKVAGAVPVEEGYLINGGIIVEYGFQIEGILVSEGVWTFNFHDPLFDYKKNMNMITFQRGTTFFYCHKQLLTHHSTYFDSDSNENQMIELTDSIGFVDFLQIAHGVRGRVNFESISGTLRSAQKYKLLNVIQLIDQIALLRLPGFKIAISEAISSDLNHYLADLLKKQDSFEGLTEELKKVDLEAISGEVMKKLVKFFLVF
uniref:BTB domain-containing protein n=1 Tax=Caenorhabditis tropicalis TaxID=1561998 RepID=A0A1I7UKS0_9PELO